jgi:hypothetical protein
MAAELHELWDSRAFEVTDRGAGVTRRWMSRGSTDETEIYVAALAANAVVFDGLVRQEVRTTVLGGGVAIVEVRYGVLDANGAVGQTPGAMTAPTDTTPLGRGQVGGAGVGGNLSFDITAQTVHITQSRETRYRRAPADGAGAGVGTAPNTEKAIGITKDAIEGCDILGPKLEWSVVAHRANVFLPYLRTIRSTVGKTNNAAFYGFDRGEVLYLGASGQPSPDGQGPKWTVTHKFAAGENELNVAVGNGITVPDKRAWEYLWVAYEEKKVGNLTLPVPAAAYVEVVYAEANFANLQIGA